ncbi:MAG: response regulator, partial [Deltaproteobacteria bacterium]|nr:response regulator [Deltaproteobacteria bacterium]
IINIPDLLRSAAAAVGPARAPEPRVDVKKRSVLVAEDSITSRMLLKNILETAGYAVMTAVDGVDAWTLAKTEKFDIIVSDVEMPRMNGFELTARLRADKELSEIPVVLVTALETREDRERGIDSGANAYMIKSSFNQNNLLEIIKRLTP